jgi:hypothetical protein
MLLIVNLIGPLARNRDKRYVHRITSGKSELSVTLLESLLEYEDTGRSTKEETGKRAWSRNNICRVTLH